MEFLSNLNHDQKLSLIKAVHKMVHADGKIALIEDLFLKRMIGSMGMDLSVIESLSNDSLEEMEIPKSEPDRMAFLYQVLFLMKMDKSVTEEEMSVCKEVGFRLGFNPDMVEDMIKIMIDHLKEQVPTHKMIETIKKYMN